jgi:hypothetical protein
LEETLNASFSHIFPEKKQQQPLGVFCKPFCDSNFDACCNKLACFGGTIEYLNQLTHK